MQISRSQPNRSALYLPASNARALDKARNLGCDLIIFDLEDAVAPDQKAAARQDLAAALAQGGYGNRQRIVRINALDSAWGPDDAAALGAMAPDGALLPKVNGPQDIDALAALAPGLPLWAMVETPVGVLNAAQIAAHPAVVGLVLGTNDLAKELGAAPGRAPLQYALQVSLMAARAHGVVALDGVYNAYRDLDGLKAECEEGRAMGYDGKTLIHPGQIETANTVFAPSPAELELARQQIAAYDDARANGQGIAVLNGSIVENLHVATAKTILQKAAAIAMKES
ncbi:MAG: CoA ester lyase [Rhodobacteraceae bacterium]|nr:CoA ester lyase [Paracoccaceae bacterium]